MRRRHGAAAPVPGLLALALAVASCLPAYDHPCTTHADCAQWPGFCNCIDGLCFRFGCPSVDSSGADADVAPTVTCAPSDLSCCPTDGSDRSARSACVKATGKTAPAPLFAPVVHDSGEVMVLATEGPSGARLLRHGVTLGETARTSFPAHPRGFLALRDGRTAVTEGSDVVLVEASGATSRISLGAAVAGPPVELGPTRLLVPLANGTLVESTATAKGLTSPPLFAPGAAVEVSVFAATTRAALIDATGVLHIVALAGVSDAKLIPSGASEGKVLGAPAIDAQGRVYAVTASGSLTGLVASGGSLYDRLASVTVGLAPFSPVVGPNDVVAAASGTEKRVVAVSYVGTAATTLLIAGPAELADVPIASPIIDGAGTVIVALANNDLVALVRSGGGTTARVAWRYARPSRLAGGLALLEDGTLVAADDSGGLARLVGGSGPGTAPWPLAHHDRRGSGASGL